MDSKWESLNLVLNEHHHLCQKIWFPLPRLRLEHCPDLPLLFPATGTLSLHICLAFVEDKEIRCPNLLSFGFGSYSSNCSRKSVHGWTGICYYHGSYFVTLVLLLDHLKPLVSGDGAVIPATYKQIMPGIIYSLQVGLSTQTPSGRVRISMRRGFCTDAAGNLF
jgi:hypothetical protein